MQPYTKHLSIHLPYILGRCSLCVRIGHRLTMSFVCSITLLFCCFSLDLLWAMWLECIWLRIMTCQTWLKNLKRLKRTWKPRRNPLVPDACPALCSGPKFPPEGSASFIAASQSCVPPQPQTLPVASEPTWGQKSRSPAASLPPVTSVQLLLSPKTGIMVLG